MTPEELQSHIDTINSLSLEGMARLWRYAPTGHIYFDYSRPLWEHFGARFSELGGFSPEISKAIDV